jgi:exosortase family protein XrtM
VDFQTLRFVVIAAVLYGLMHFAYHKVPDETLREVVYPSIIGHAAAKTINTLTPERNVRVSDNKISSNKAVLNIVRGCDGSGVWFMLLAAVLGFGAKFKETLVGLVLGSLTVYLINQVRIVGLYYLVEYNRMLFPPVHTYFAPTLIVFIIAGFFLWWTRWVSIREQKSNK